MAKELTEQHKRFLEVLFADAGGNINQAMRMAGFSEGYSRRSLTNYLKEEIIEATQLYIAMAAPKAAVAMINAIDDLPCSGSSVDGIRNPKSQIIRRCVERRIWKIL